MKNNGTFSRNSLPALIRLINVEVDWSKAGTEKLRSDVKYFLETEKEQQLLKQALLALEQKKSTKELVDLYQKSNGQQTKIAIAKRMVDHRHAEGNQKRFFFWVFQLHHLELTGEGFLVSHPDLTTKVQAMAGKTSQHVRAKIELLGKVL